MQAPVDSFKKSNTREHILDCRVMYREILPGSEVRQGGNSVPILEKFTCVHSQLQAGGATAGEEPRYSRSYAVGW
jgi:hypothetical protein